MTQTMPRKPTPLRDVLYEFALAREVPDADLLEEFTRDYPEHAEALTEFAIELAGESLRSTPEVLAVDTTRVSPAVSRAMSRFHNALHGVRARKAEAAARNAAEMAPVENPFKKYDQRGFRALAADVNVNTLFLCKLRDRQIAPGTIPAAFVRLLAEKMQESVERLAAFLNSQSAVLHAGQFYKAEQKPEAGAQQSFEEAVRTSHLTEEQKRFLLGL
jgi:hypothetical protein